MPKNRVTKCRNNGRGILHPNEEIKSKLKEKKNGSQSEFNPSKLLASGFGYCGQPQLLRAEQAIYMLRGGLAGHMTRGVANNCYPRVVCPNHVL